MKTISKLLKLILVLLVLGLFLASPIIYKGYKLYSDASENNGVFLKVSEVKAKDTYLLYNQIPKEYFQHLIKSEDRRFYSHKGIDIKSIARAAYKDIKAMAFVEGGSTITQQLSKNLFFSFDKKLSRKVAECFMAVELEGKYSKEDILELYANVCYFGEDCYGLSEASVHYFGVSPQDMTIEEMDMLIKTIKSPSMVNPNTMRNDINLLKNYWFSKLIYQIV